MKSSLMTLNIRIRTHSDSKWFSSSLFLKAGDWYKGYFIKKFTLLKKNYLEETQINLCLKYNIQKNSFYYLI